MVKLNWFEGLVIYIIVFVIMAFFTREMGYDVYNTWFSIIFWVILYLVIVNIILKGIEGKDRVKEPKQNKGFGKWWKKQKTFAKVLIIFVFTILLIVGLALIPDLPPSYESDERIGDLDRDNQKLIKISIKSLEEDGYEVLYFGVFERDNSAYVKMKSLGRRNEQVWGGLSSLSWVYPNASEYDVRILEESQDCWYFIKGVLYRAFLGEEFILNGTEIDSSTAWQLIEYQIQNPNNCS